jgi:hypothetical protein
MIKTSDLQGLQVEIGVPLLAEVSADMRGYTFGYAGIRARTASSAQSGRYAVRNAVSALNGAARPDLVTRDGRELLLDLNGGVDGRQCRSDRVFAPRPWPSIASSSPLATTFACLVGAVALVLPSVAAVATSPASAPDVSWGAGCEPR